LATLQPTNIAFPHSLSLSSSNLPYFVRLPVTDNFRFSISESFAHAPTMSFETGEMASALPEITNGDHPEATGPPKDPEAFDNARKLGWVAPEEYSYASSKVANSADASATFDQGAQPQWAHEAAKYEWKEEYGDVGPAVPELEEQLFGNEYISRKGTKMEQ
jgi:hypothetical protein